MVIMAIIKVLRYQVPYRVSVKSFWKLSKLRLPLKSSVKALTLPVLKAERTVICWRKCWFDRYLDFLDL